MPVTNTFTPPVDPDPEAKWDYKPRILKTEFGDTLAQRAADGINNNPATLSLVWTQLTAAQKTTIINFFQARRGYQAFNYTYPGDSARVFMCDDFSWSHNAPDNYTVSATLQQVYDLV